MVTIFLVAELKQPPRIQVACQRLIGWMLCLSFALIGPAIVIGAPVEASVEASVELAQQEQGGQVERSKHEGLAKRIDGRYDLLILQAFRKVHDGWSSDEVILRDELNAAFLKEVRKGLTKPSTVDRVNPRATSSKTTQPNETQPDLITDAQLNWRLLGLRKAGKLNVKTTRRATSDTSEVIHIAEMATRTLQDQHTVSTDQIMTDPMLRKEFDQAVQSILPKSDPYLVRKAAFQLRKSRRLRPELIVRIADWGRKIKTYSTVDLKRKPDLVAEHPGIYIFRDQTGYLYIGQTENLRKRLQSHLDHSHNLSLARYLDQDRKPTVEVHSFDPGSRAKEARVRRAYESELIASRKPRFNIQP